MKINLGLGSLTIGLIILKVLEVISISWVLVFVPLMVSVFFAIVSVILGLVVAKIAKSSIENLASDLDQEDIDDFR